MSYADVNGIWMYYEEHGSGQPLILLHGGYATSETSAAILPSLASGRRVITPAWPPAPPTSPGCPTAWAGGCSRCRYRNSTPR